MKILRQSPTITNKRPSWKIFRMRTFLDFHAPSTSYMEETGLLAPQDKLRSQQGIRVSSPHVFLCCVFATTCSFFLCGSFLLFVSQLISLIHITSHILVIRDTTTLLPSCPHWDPFSSYIENQTTNLIIFTEKTAGTAAIEKEATKKAILSMIIQPLCSFSTLICSSSLSHLVFLVFVLHLTYFQGSMIQYYKWDSIFMWLFLGKLDSNSIFYLLPMEAVFHFVQASGLFLQGNNY